MKVLITGGAGFIGLHLARYLFQKGLDISICDNLSRGQVDEDFNQLITSSGNINFIEIDLTRREDFNKLETSYDYVFHLAAINGTRNFYEIPDKVLRVNILGLINVLDWIVGIECKKLVWLSSSETYAGTEAAFGVPIPTSEDIPLTIDDVFNPRYSYAESKIAGELLCINYARVFNFCLSIVRPHNIYGPRMGYDHVIPEFMGRIIRNEDPFRIFGGDQTRSFCYVDDFVQGLELVCEASVTNGEIINLGNDEEEIKMVDLAKKMFRQFGVSPELEIMPAPAGSTKRRCPDIRKARDLVGYQPRFDLEKGLDFTYQWYHDKFI